MTRNIGTDAEITQIRVKESAAPGTPAAGYRYLYVKTTGLWLKDDAGNEYQISPDVIGTAGQSLRVNSTANGVEYVSGGRVFISEQTPTGTTASFTSIPATYKHLVIEYVCRSTKAAVTSENMRCFLNNDTTLTNYRSARMYGYAAGTVGGDGGEDSNIDDPPAANAPANSCSRGVVNILFYAGTTFNKQILCEAASRRDAATVYEFRISSGVEWEATTAVNRVDFVLVSGNFVAGSTFRLYGVY